MRIDELFSKPQKVKWVEKHPDWWRAICDVDGVEYSITCGKNDGYYMSSHGNRIEIDDFWELGFGPTNNSLDNRILGLKEPFKLFAIVMAGFFEFITKVKPQYINFTADGNQPSRVKLYRAFEIKFLPTLEKIGYEKCKTPTHRFSIVNNSRWVGFCFRRN